MANVISSRHVTCPILTRDLLADLLAFTDWSPPRQHRYIHTQKHASHFTTMLHLQFQANAIWFSLTCVVFSQFLPPIHSERFISYVAA